MPPFFRSDYYELRYEPAPPLLHGRAARGMSVEEFTEVCEQFLLLARARQCRYWLLDGRQDVNQRPPGIYTWLSDDYLPRVRALLGEPPCLAFVATPELWAQLARRGYGPDAPNRVGSLSFTGWFVDEARAAQWLAKFRDGA